MDDGTRITSEVYCNTLRKLKRAIHNKRLGLLTSEVMFLYNNAYPHISLRTQGILRQFKWDVFNHSPYSPDLAPSDYRLFTYMKKWLRAQYFADDEELQDAVTSWLNSREAEFYAVMICTLVKHYDKSDYV
ncbi:hypothetical protein AVEN_257476-1 [Araneus ventricosus]|uniref:Histone-lysine N-methyltransferase SETMAR n=1 Tax=Araneus ventricosus TaxID=182803 RepID=A0A4Y2TWZ7_ARAVE|nr:hypothetical protein AVEN_257476-1 [Araneus ventricosus]